MTNHLHNFQLYKYSALISSILLSACGGGSDSSSSNTAKDQDALYQVYFQERSMSYQIYEDFFGLSQYPIHDGKINFKNSNQVLNQYVVNAEKLFQPTEKQESYLTIDADDTWTYHYLPNVDLKMTVKKIDLSGENIYDRVLPGYRTYIDFDSTINESDENKSTPYLLYKYHGNKTFPQGSSCYQVIETQWSQDFIEFDELDEYESSYPNKDSFNAEKVAFRSELEEIYGVAEVDQLFKTGTWQGIDWYSNLGTYFDFFDFESAQLDYSQYDLSGRYYPTRLWTLSEQLANSSYTEIDPNDEEILRQIALEVNLSIAMSEFGCFAYNKTAFDSISKLKNVRYKNFDQPKLSFFFGKRSYNTSSDSETVIE